MTSVLDDLVCQELVELVTDYLEGAMSPDQRARFERHLADCPYCASYLEQIRRTIRLVGALGDHDLDPEARASLLAAFRTWRAG
ncbi:MAG: anti-sigma factor [Dehalococcoidia bacterium]